MSQIIDKHSTLNLN